MRSAARQLPMWHNEVWDILLSHIESGKVIPVIGPELAVINVDGTDQTVDQYVARKLAEALDLPVGEDVDGDGRFTLNDVVAGAVRDNHREQHHLHAKINNILAASDLQPSISLQKLARITDFRLYVTLTFDSLLTKALVTAGRGTVENIQSIGYAPRMMPMRDLKEDVRNLAFPTVYHLLGRHVPTPEFVISDDDLLEYIVGLQSESAPSRLLDEMKAHSLLFLGGNFPDWLLRMLLRLTKQRRLSLPREMPGALEILADSHSRKSASLTSFLVDFSPQTRIYDTDGDAFIDELYIRWQGRKKPLGPVLQIRPFVFLSYTREDVDAARVAAALLEAAGLDCWFDEQKLRGGEGYWSTIEDKIETCTIFMPLLSRTTEARRTDANFRREWALANQRSLGHSHSVRFIFPIIIDDLEVREVKEAPKTFTGSHIWQFAQGNLDAAFIADIDQLLKGGR